jgi:DNA repair protein RAD57
MYISTESSLPTSRLSQILASNPVLADAKVKPSLDRIISIVTPDLESQDHILKFQVPVAIKKYNIGLIILDSVAANYRAEFDRPPDGTPTGRGGGHGAHMAKRSAELVKLGQHLRDIARTENIAVVVANQVGDRFTRFGDSPMSRIQSSPLAHQFMPLPSSGQSSLAVERDIICPINSPDMLLDHQLRWFTGWGDDPQERNPKTPSLGLIWTEQIACRIALIKSPVYGPGIQTDDLTGETVLKRWKRWMKVVFSPWAASGGQGVDDAVEFEITRGGLKAVSSEITAGDKT